MHVIWKRPDGFLNAQPEDFRRVSLSGGAQLWLHRSDTEWYPFQVSGDWAGQDETMRLNRMVNLLDRDDVEWSRFLERESDTEGGREALSSLQGAPHLILSWLENLKAVVKGNTWEAEIMANALSDVQSRIRKLCN
jgi:hypothetical protein